MNRPFLLIVISDTCDVEASVKHRLAVSTSLADVHGLASEWITPFTIWRTEKAIPNHVSTFTIGTLFVSAISCLLITRNVLEPQVCGCDP